MIGPAPDDNPTERLTVIGPEPSIGRSSSLMAVASLVSRITGFLRQVALFTALGATILNDAYTVANTLPNIVYELLLGGALSSVMIPLLVRAQKEDPDGGEAYTRKLITLAAVALLLATAIGVAAAPLLTRLYMGAGATSTADPELATTLAYLLLPQIFFYGLGAILGAILNSKGAFGAFAWAPVLNNVVVLGVVAAYLVVPDDARLLVLGVGTTLGIVVQTLVLLPALRRAGFRYRPLWGWDPRLTQASGLAVWALLYVLIGQAGLIVTTRIATGADGGAYAIYSNAWLLLQVPYGVLGVSLLTALMPRMSRAAADGRTEDLAADLGLGSKLASVLLVPISVLLTVFGTAVGVALFGLRSGNLDGANDLGAVLAVSAFGLLPFAITMLQLRVFYALTDSRTATLVQLFTVGGEDPADAGLPDPAPAGERGAGARRSQQCLLRVRRRARADPAAPQARPGPDRRGPLHDRAHAARVAGRDAARGRRGGTARHRTVRRADAAGQGLERARGGGRSSAGRSRCSACGCCGCAKWTSITQRLERLVDRRNPRRRTSA